ncbi:hypothetical protein EVC45_10205 [Paraburkholderia sp. UYCP14C]|uniref:hypothetical protein n=1 Tax=Paraburkholderia sp. UYCP14C TaxID=2511130 RepID=UPI00101F93C6|nr:hypothetical protein [Paraburkholderia sp. UYCP14C]RZF29961.1 hypothetical protein EVC45_10205 [Paraburkholderia sp. UYCP14C]
MVSKKFRRVAARRSAGAGAYDLNSVLEVTMTGGLPADDPMAVEAAQAIHRHVTSEGQRVRVIGGLPDGLQGEQWTAEQRQQHDDEHYARAFGLVKQNPVGG